MRNREIRRAYRDYYKQKANRINEIQEMMDLDHPLMFKRYN